MELQCNLGWLAVSISLWGWWLARRRGAKQGSLLPAVAVQWTALAIVTAILLPVISVTDDLHDCQLPAEVKRSLVQSDRHSASEATLDIVPFALARPALAMNLLRPRRIGFLALEQRAPLQQMGYLHPLWSRPPPAS